MRPPDPTLDSAEPKAVERLIDELDALERAMTSWDLPGIAARGAGARSALELVRRSWREHGSLPTANLGELMRRTRRCLALAAQGEMIAQSLARMTSLTYAPPTADRWRDAASSRPNPIALQRAALPAAALGYTEDD